MLGDYIGRTVTWSSPKLGIELVGEVVQARLKRARVPSKTEEGLVVWELTTQPELFVVWPDDGPEDCWFTPGDSIIRLDDGDVGWLVKVISEQSGDQTVIVQAPTATIAGEIAVGLQRLAPATVVETTRYSDLF